MFSCIVLGYIKIYKPISVTNYNTFAFHLHHPKKANFVSWEQTVKCVLNEITYIYIDIILKNFMFSCKIMTFFR